MPDIDQVDRSFFVYMDVLGFSEVVKESYRQKAQNEVFNKFFNAINLAKEKAFKRIGQEKFEVKIFTDNVVLIHPLADGSVGVEEFLSFASGVAIFQLYMAINGFFVRGAVTFGKIYFDDTIVYGMPLIGSVELEKEKANDPKVILDKGVEGLMKEQMRLFIEPQKTPQNYLILKDVDQQCFVNYLLPTIIELPSTWSYLEQHKAKIEENLVKFISAPKVWAKYFWAANYHNYFCEANSSREGYKSTFKIDEALVKKHPSTLL